MLNIHIPIDPAILHAHKKMNMKTQQHCKLENITKTRKYSNSCHKKMAIEIVTMDYHTRLKMTELQLYATRQISL